MKFLYIICNFIVIFGAKSEAPLDFLCHVSAKCMIKKKKKKRCCNKCKFILAQRFSAVAPTRGNKLICFRVMVLVFRKLIV